MVRGLMSEPSLVGLQGFRVLGLFLTLTLGDTRRGLEYGFRV